MDFADYAKWYDEFHAEFFPKAGTLEKRRKLFDETVELQTAIIDHERQSGNRANIIDEAIDCMNTSIAYLRSEGILDPLWHGVQKLERTREKYLKQKEQVVNGIQ